MRHQAGIHIKINTEITALEVKFQHQTAIAPNLGEVKSLFPGNLRTELTLGEGVFFSQYFRQNVGPGAKISEKFEETTSILQSVDPGSFSTTSKKTSQHFG